MLPWEQLEKFDTVNSEALVPVIWEVAPSVTVEPVPFPTVMLWKLLEPSIVVGKINGLGEATTWLEPLPTKGASRVAPEGEPVKTMCKFAGRAPTPPGGQRSGMIFRTVWPRLRKLRRHQRSIKPLKESMVLKSSELRQS
jgi:hypothetical protein